MKPAEMVEYEYVPGGCQTSVGVFFLTFADGTRAVIKQGDTGVRAEVLAAVIVKHLSPLITAGDSSALVTPALSVFLQHSAASQGLIRQLSTLTQEADDLETLMQIRHKLTKGQCMMHMERLEGTRIDMPLPAKAAPFALTASGLRAIGGMLVCDLLFNKYF
jgi:hypothetical protein